MPFISERLKALRASEGLSQKAVADAIHIDERNYRRYENGETDPSVTNAAMIADYFGVSIDYLVGRTDKPEINR